MSVIGTRMEPRDVVPIFTWLQPNHWYFSGLNSLGSLVSQLKRKSSDKVLPVTEGWWKLYLRVDVRGHPTKSVPFLHQMSSVWKLISCLVGITRSHSYLTPFDIGILEFDEISPILTCLFSSCEHFLYPSMSPPKYLKFSCFKSRLFYIDKSNNSSW